jgi:hypothetical protein
MDARDPDDISDDAPTATGVLQKYAKATEKSGGEREVSVRGYEEDADEDRGGKYYASDESDESDEDDEDYEDYEDYESDEDDLGDEKEEDGDGEGGNGNGEMGGAARSDKRVRAGTPYEDDGEEDEGDAEDDTEGGENEDDGEADRGGEANDVHVDDEATEGAEGQANRISPKQASRLLERLSKRYRLSGDSSEEKSSHSDDGYDSDDDYI